MKKSWDFIRHFQNFWDKTFPEDNTYFQKVRHLRNLLSLFYIPLIYKPGCSPPPKDILGKQSKKVEPRNIWKRFVPTPGIFSNIWHIPKHLGNIFHPTVSSTGLFPAAGRYFGETVKKRSSQEIFESALCYSS